MTDPLLDNRPRVVAGKTIRARNCDRCRTFADVTITWAVPLDEGGERSVWNTVAMCGGCRAERAEEALTNTSKIFPNGAPRWVRESKPEPTARRGHPGVAVAKGDRVFDALTQAAREFGVHASTILRWVETGHNGWRRVGA